MLVEYLTYVRNILLTDLFALSTCQSLKLSTLGTTWA